MNNIDKRCIELRAAEGGADARMLVPMLGQAYLDYAAKNG
jgi:protein subunit release factor A